MKTKHFAIVVVMLLSIAAEAAPPAGSTQVFVSFKAGKKGAVKQAITAAGGTITYENDSVEAVAATVPTSAIETLAARGDVAFVEEDPERKVMADRFDWGLEAVQGRLVWDANNDGNFDSGAPLGAGKTVCIIDTGLQKHHPDLAGVNVKGGVSVVPDGPWDDDVFGHGTFIAGIIAAQKNGIGAVGIAPAVSIYSVRAANDQGSMSTSTLMRAADLCVAAGANVINMSLGGFFASRAEERFWAGLSKKNVLLVAAAGNEGVFIHQYPASYDSVISVAAVDRNLRDAFFSNASEDVELTAPGVEIFAAFPRQEFFEMSVNGGAPIQGLPLGGMFDRGVASGRLEWGGDCMEPGNFAGAIAICNFSYSDGTDLILNNMIASGASGVILLGFGGYYNDRSYPIVTLALDRTDGKNVVHGSLTQPASLNTTLVNAPGYRIWQGTSFSTPHVAGVAALIWSKYPKKTAAQVRAAMTATARDLGPAGRDPFNGYGLVQAQAALQYLSGH